MLYQQFKVKFKVIFPKSVSTALLKDCTSIQTLSLKVRKVFLLDLIVWTRQLTNLRNRLLSRLALVKIIAVVGFIRKRKSWENRKCNSIKSLFRTNRIKWNKKSKRTSWDKRSNQHHKRLLRQLIKLLKTNQKFRQI